MMIKYTGRSLRDFLNQYFMRDLVSDLGKIIMKIYENNRDKKIRSPLRAFYCKINDVD